MQAREMEDEAVMFYCDWHVITAVIIINKLSLGPQAENIVALNFMFADDIRLKLSLEHRVFLMYWG